MTCPICDQKPMNCDCTDRERRMYRELNDVVELRLTGEEERAIREAADAYALNNDDADCERIERVLRGLLDRTAVG